MLWNQSTCRTGFNLCFSYLGLELEFKTIEIEIDLQESDDGTPAGYVDDNNAGEGYLGVPQKTPMWTIFLF